MKNFEYELYSIFLDNVDCMNSVVYSATIFNFRQCLSYLGVIITGIRIN